MREIAVTAFASPIDKPRMFQVGNQLAHLARHFGIRVVSHATLCQHGQTPLTRVDLLLLDVVTSGFHFVSHLQNGGAEGSRTPDLLIANETLYQLSYDPIMFIFSGLP